MRLDSMVFPCLIVVCLLDAVTTLAAVGVGGVELNPLVAPLVPFPAVFVGVKIMVPVVAWGLWLRSSRRLGPVLVVLVVAVLPVVWNVSELYGLV